MRSLTTDRALSEPILMVIVTKMIWILYTLHLHALAGCLALFSAMLFQTADGGDGHQWPGLAWAHRNWSYAGGSTSTSHCSQHTVHGDKHSED